MKSFNLPKRCSNTTNTFRSGARITSRWSNAWWTQNVALADPKESVTLKPPSTKNSSRSFGKHAPISTRSTATVVVHLHAEARTQWRKKEDRRHVRESNSRLAGKVY